MNYDHSGDPLTFHLGPFSGLNFNLTQNFFVYDQILEKPTFPSASAVLFVLC